MSSQPRLTKWERVSMGKHGEGDFAAGETPPRGSATDSARAHDQSQSSLYSAALHSEVAAAGHGQGSLHASDPMKVDFSWWRDNTVDVRTGRTVDPKMQYNTAGEDRGVCRHALSGTVCPLGAACHYSHPVRVYKQSGLETHCAVTELRERTILEKGDCARVKILAVESVYHISIWILKRLPEHADLDGLDFEVKQGPEAPKGYAKFAQSLNDFYQKADTQYLTYPNLLDISDVYVAVYSLVSDAHQWRRGAIVDMEDGERGGKCLKVKLLDVGCYALVNNPAHIQRLDKKFLNTSWFSTVIALDGVMQASLSCTESRRWFQKLLVGKTGVMKVTASYTCPLVEMLMDDVGGLESVTLKQYLVKEGFVRESSQKPDDDSEDSDEENSVVFLPG